jgi:Holliday junction resolvase
MKRRSQKKPFKGKDASQDGIIAALQEAGCTVQDLCRFGDVPDLLVGYHGRNYLIECKPAEGDKRQLNLNPKQAEWHEKWRGQVAVAHTPEEALAIIMVK